MPQIDSAALNLCMFTCLSDNYGFLLHDQASGETVCIDTPDAEEILRQADERGWTITQIWNTHWHPDHAGGNEIIKARTGCSIIGPQEVREHNSGPIDRVVGDGDSATIGRWRANVIATPGHTLGHIVYHLPDAGMAFVGDTLFALGCGRLFEGDAGQMWDSLSKLAALPEDTQVYCAHEYTADNLAFAETVDPENASLRTYGVRVRELRAEGKPTVPTTIGLELAANPFMRADDPALQAKVGRPNDAVQTFAVIREGKNNFKPKPA